MVNLILKNHDTNLAYMLDHSEFRCKCSRDNCTFTLVSPMTLIAWERLRRTLKRRIHITSGFRCQGHNRDVGGKDHSRHTKGLAMDLMPGSNLKFETMVREAEKVFDYVQVYEKEGFIHCHMLEELFKARKSI